MMEDFILVPTPTLVRDLNHTQIILLWVIWKLVIKGKGRCSPTNSELSNLVWVDTRTIQRCLKKLVDMWYIDDGGWQKCHWGVTKMSPIEMQEWTGEKPQKRVLTTKMSPPIYNKIYSIYTTSSKKEERNIKKEEREKMLEVFRKDDRLVRFINEEDAVRWRDYKQASKKPYKDIDSFIIALVKMKNIIQS